MTGTSLKNKMAEVETLETQEISPKHRHIIEGILRGEDGTKLYFDLYDCKDMANASACMTRLLNNVNVQAYYQKRKEQVARRIETATNASILRTVQELICIAYVDPLNFFDEHDNLKKISEIDEVTRRSISSIKVREMFEEIEIEGKKEKKFTGYVKEIKMNNKNTALRTLAEHLGMLQQEKNEWPNGQPGGTATAGEVQTFVVPAINRRVSLPAPTNGNNGNHNSAASPIPSK